MKEHDEEHLAFEKMGIEMGLDLEMHPLHLLYLNPKTHNYLQIFKAGYAANQSQLSEAKAQLSQLNNGWGSVDGAESQLTERGYYWWNPRYAVNQGKFHWTVIYSDPMNGQEKQGVFVGPIPSPPEGQK